jgi:hypothetical protein
LYRTFSYRRNCDESESRGIGILRAFGKIWVA